MANAHFDENHVPTLIVVDSANGTGIVPVKVNPTDHGMIIDDNTTGTDFGPANSIHDDSFVPVLMAVSSADGITPVAVYGNASTGALLIDSA